MRPTPLLRQIAGASTQRKLPLPTIYPPGSVPRLTPPRADFLPSLINAPTTLPPVFIPPPEVDSEQRWDVAKKLFYKARSYYKFYKEGIKQANSNRKIRKFLKSELMKSFAHINIPGTANIVMTRSEFQLCVRTRRDWRKMPLFGVVALIFGEFTPIIVWLFGTSFLPGTCITTAQLDNRRRKRMDDLDRKNLPVTPRVTPTIEQVQQLPRRTIIHECRILCVFPRWIPIYLFPTIFLREMLIRRVNYLEYDDELIRQFAQPDLKDMHIDEIKLALEERGVSLYNTVPLSIDKTGLQEKPSQEIYKLMIYWLKLNDNKHPDRTFAHEHYLKEMIRFYKLPDL